MYKVAPGTKPLHKIHPMHRLEDVVRAIGSSPDTYLSQASFVRARRQVSAFAGINCAFVDIDCYSDKPHSPRIMPDDKFVARLFDAARTAGVPEPSYATYSGRGVYLKWVFDQPITAHSLPRWQALQSVLVPIFTPFGVDAGARDAARVLRVMGSTHSSAEGVVRVAHSTDKRHNFDKLCRMAEAVDKATLIWPAGAKKPAAVVGASARAEPRARAPRRIKTSDPSRLLLDGSGDLGVLEAYAAAHQPVMLGHGSKLSLNWNRFLDLRTLAELRGGIHEGSRDLMLFWMATFLGHSGIVTSENLLSEIGGLVGAFDGPGFDPVGDGSMTTLIQRIADHEAGRTVHFKGGEYNPIYTPSNDYLIDVLGITREEQELMSTLIDSGEKQRRADAKVEGRAERRQFRLEWRAHALGLATVAKAAGKPVNISEIAKQVGVSRSQVSRLLAGKLDRDPNRKETRGRKSRKKRSGTLGAVTAVAAASAPTAGQQPELLSRAPPPIGHNPFAGLDQRYAAKPAKDRKTEATGSGARRDPDLPLSAEPGLAVASALGSYSSCSGSVAATATSTVPGLGLPGATAPPAPPVSALLPLSKHDGERLPIASRSSAFAGLDGRHAAAPRSGSAVPGISMTPQGCAVFSLSRDKQTEDGVFENEKRGLQPAGAQKISRNSQFQRPEPERPAPSSTTPAVGGNGRGAPPPIGHKPNPFAGLTSNKERAQRREAAALERYHAQRQRELTAVVEAAQAAQAAADAEIRRAGGIPVSDLTPDEALRYHADQAAARRTEEQRLQVEREAALRQELRAQAADLVVRARAGAARTLAKLRGVPQDEAAAWIEKEVAR